MNKIAPVVLLTLALVAPAHADSWMAPTPVLASSPDGSHYVIVNPRTKEHPTRFLFAARGKGAGRRADVGGSSPRGSGEPLELDAGDTLVAEGECTMPMRVICLDGGAGFMLFETYASLGYGDVLVRFDGKGEAMWKLRLDDMFTPKEIEGFMHSVSSIWWYRGFWVDEPAGLIVVVAKQDELRAFSLTDGSRKDVDDETVERFAGSGAGDSTSRQLALELAAERGIELPADELRRQLEEAADDAALGLRLAIHLATTGDKTARKRILTTARDESADLALRSKAIENLGIALGADAWEPLLALARNMYEMTALPASVGLSRMPGALERLQALLDDPDSPDHWAALSALSKLPRTQAIPALIDALGKVSDRDHQGQARSMLRTLTHVDHQTNAREWRRWWKSHKDE